MTAEQISKYFGLKSTTVANKAREIKRIFNLWHYNPEFSTQRMTENNPFNNLVMVDGLIVPLDTLPINLQKIVKEARAKGDDMEFFTE